MPRLLFLNPGISAGRQPLATAFCAGSGSRNT